VADGLDLFSYVLHHSLMNSETNNQVLTPAEVAARLRCHVVTVRRYIHAGHLKAKKLQRRYRVPAAELERSLAADKTRGGAAVSAPGFPTWWLPLDERGARHLRGYRRMAKTAEEGAGRKPAHVGAPGDWVVGFMVFDNSSRRP
jgi:excisionase family DNA binding protein